MNKTLLALGSLALFAACSTGGKKPAVQAEAPAPVIEAGAKRTPAGGGPRFTPRPGEFRGHWDIDRGMAGRDPGDIRYCLDTQRTFEAENGPVAREMLEACIIGVELARSFAQDYAGGWGRMHGFSRGYSWELWETAEEFDHDPTALGQGGAMGTAVAQYNQALALQDGGTAGYNSGYAGGRSEAISRFEAAVDRATSVSDQYAPPTPNFAGISNACQLSDRVVIPDSLRTGPEYQLRSSRQICETPTKQDLMARGYVLVPSELEIYQYTDAMKMAEMQHLGPRDLWSNDGHHDFDQNVWRENPRAFKVFERTYSHARKFEFNRLGVTSWRENPPNPPGDAAPDPRAPRPETQPRGGAQRDYDLQVRPAPIEHRVDLRAIANESFARAYEYYKVFYYSKEYNDYLPYGRAQGYAVGQLVGQSYAFHSARRRAFEDAFVRMSQNEFFGKFRGGYDAGFRQWYTEYSTKPQLTVQSFDSINGKDSDGILQAGELISTQFSVKNAGGVSVPLNVTVSGTVVDAQTRTFVAERLKTRQFSAQDVARVDPRLGNNSEARILLHVNDTVKARDERVQRPVVMTGFGVTSLDPIQGGGMIRVSIHNNMTRQTGTDVCVRIVVAARELAHCQFIHVINPNEDAVVDLPFGGLDPLSLIDGQAYGTRAELYSSGTLMASSDGEVRAMGDAESMLFEYFRRLMGDQNAGDRFHEVMGRIIQMNREEVAANHTSDGSNVWRKQPDLTVVGRVIRLVEGGGVSPARKADLFAMDQQFWGVRKSLKKFIFPGPKRANFERLCKKLAELLGHSAKELK